MYKRQVIDAVKAKDMERAEMYAWDITNILVGDNTSNEKIWENGEKSTIAAAILCVVVDNAKRPQYQKDVYKRQAMQPLRFAGSSGKHRHHIGMEGIARGRHGSSQGTAYGGGTDRRAGAVQAGACLLYTSRQKWHHRQW